MKTIFWYQPVLLSEKDVLLYNGEKLPFNKERTAIFLQLDSIADKKIGEKLPWCGFVDNYFFFKGYLNVLDEKGRQVVFMFATDDKEYSLELNKHLSLIGYKLSESSLQSLKTGMSKGKNPVNKSVKIVGFLLLIAILIALIFVSISIGD